MTISNVAILNTEIKLITRILTYQNRNVISQVQGQWTRLFHHQVVHLHEFSEVARVPREHAINVTDTSSLQIDFFEYCRYGLVFHVNRHH
jgi:hypothetical protein